MGILFFLKRAFWFVVDNWKIFVPAIVILIAAIWIRSCWSAHKAKLNEKQIIAAQQAIAKNDREEMQRVLVEAEVEEKQIDANLAEGEHEKLVAIQEAKRKAAKMTNEQLAAELERLANE